MLDGVISAFANLFVQIIFTAGIVGLCGIFISFCNRLFYDCLGKTAFSIVRFSGIIGTPVHELSHALMCLLFGHRITKIQIYNFKKRSKTLGFVEHTYNKRNLYHQIGNFFIGISPIVVGGLAVTLCVRLLTPVMYNAMTEEISNILSSKSNIFARLISGTAKIFVSFFSISNLANWRWWLCVLLSFAISVHMEISRSDIKGGLKGLTVISVLLLVADIVLALLFPDALSAVTSAFFSAGLYIAVFLIIPAFFAVIAIMAAGLVCLFKTLKKSIENSRN